MAITGSFAPPPSIDDRSFSTIAEERLDVILAIATETCSVLDEQTTALAEAKMRLFDQPTLCGTEVSPSPTRDTPFGGNLGRLLDQLGCAILRLERVLTLAKENNQDYRNLINRVASESNNGCCGLARR